MAATLDARKRKIEELKARRQPLFEWYEKNPNEMHLVIEIKNLDDEIAECKLQIEKDRRNRN